MAGSGKGPLRIALADWWNTTPIGKAIAKVFTDAGEGIEEGITDHYKTFIAQINKVPGLEQLLKFTRDSSGKPTSQGGIMSAAGFASGIGMQAASGLLAPYMRILNYLIDKGVKSARVDPSAAIAGYWRDPESQKLLEDDLADLGYTADRIKVLTKLSRPRMSPDQLLALMLRAKQTPDEVKAELAARGFLPVDINGILELTHVIPGVNDLISMAVREAWDDATASAFQYDAEYPAEVEEWAAKQGLDREWVKRYWRAHWILPSPGQVTEMLHRLRPGASKNPVTIDDARRLFKVADYPVFWRDRLIDISYSPYTRVDVRRMYKLKVLDENQLVGAYMDLGYDEDHARHLAEFTKRYETDSGGSKLDEYKDLTETMAKQMYLKGLINRDEYAARLSDLQYVPDDIELIISLTETQRQINQTSDQTASLQNSLQDQILKSYVLRIIGPTQAKSLLNDAGMPGDQADLAIALADYSYNVDQQNAVIKLLGDQYVARVIDRSGLASELGQLNIPSDQQNQIMLEMDRQRDYRTRRLTEAQYRLALTKGVITLDQYKEAMRGLGYNDPDIEILVAIRAIPEGS